MVKNKLYPNLDACFGWPLIHLDHVVVVGGVPHRHRSKPRPSWQQHYPSPYMAVEPEPRRNAAELHRLRFWVNDAHQFQFRRQHGLQKWVDVNSCKHAKTHFCLSVHFIITNAWGQLQAYKQHEDANHNKHSDTPEGEWADVVQPFLQRGRTLFNRTAKHSRVPFCTLEHAQRGTSVFPSFPC